VKTAVAKKLRGVFGRYGALVGLAVVVAVLSVACPGFCTSGNLINIVRQSSVHGVMAVGMTFVILTGGIDLSVGSVLALAGVLCAALEHHGAGVVLVVLGGLLIGAAAGFVNGLVVTKGKVTPFVVTLGMMSIARGLAHLYTGGQPVSGFGGNFRWVGTGVIAGVPVPIVVFAAVLVVAAVVLGRTRLGRYVYAIGSNEEAVRLCGVDVNRYKGAAYVICGAAAGLAGVVLTARLNAAETIAGTGYELDVIASVVIGGTSLMGGEGSVWGTLAGTLLIGTINNGMNLLGISPYWQLVVKGSIIVGAALLDRIRRIS